jgi:cysteinyl-tRNA synthetase
MAKSAGEFLRIKALTDRGFDPLAFRYLCLTAHYRTQLNFTFDSLDSAATGLSRLRSGFHALPADASQPDAPSVARFTGHVNDDLNVPRALAVAWEVLRGDLAPGAKRATLLQFDTVLGLGLGDWRPAEEAIGDDIRALADARLAARNARNWAESDRLRGELKAAGWDVEDRAGGYTLKPAPQGSGSSR